MSNTTTQPPKPNPGTAFLQMQKAQAQRALPKKHTSQSSSFTVTPEKPVLTLLAEAAARAGVSLADIDVAALMADEHVRTALGAARKKRGAKTVTNYYDSNDELPSHVATALHIGDEPETIPVGLLPMYAMVEELPARPAASDFRRTPVIDRPDEWDLHERDLVQPLVYL